MILTTGIRRPSDLASHPLADLFPLIGGDEFEALTADIREHGLRVPIVLYERQVLDGRNRLRACEAARVEPRFEEFTGTADEALAFVVSMNLARRHLTTPQRAALALKILPMERERARRRMEAGVADPPQDVAEGAASPTGEATELAGARVGVSKETVRQAARVAEQAPDVIEAMASGVVTSMPEAVRLAAIPMDRRTTVIDKMRTDGCNVAAAVAAVREQDRAARVIRSPVVVRRPGYELRYGVHILDALGEMTDESVHVVCTSPPYWGLRDYGTPPQSWPQISFSPMPGVAQVVVPAQEVGLGLEVEPMHYVGHLVHVLREVRRVLRDDGTLWLVIGDTYMSHGASDTANVGGFQGERHRADADRAASVTFGKRRTTGLKDKDLVGTAWMIAFALRADGWWLRSDIVWAKGNALPESVQDRPTRAHEYVFLLSKSADYFYDADAIREPMAKDAKGSRFDGGKTAKLNGGGGERADNPVGRNRRSVWSVNTRPYPGAHFAVFPPDLVEPMILAGTSAMGVCAACRAPWRRVIERTGSSWPTRRANGYPVEIKGNGDALQVQRGVRLGEVATTTTGWQPTCSCGVAEAVPAVVLDPFSGSGTTGEVALRLGRTYIGIDLNTDYLPLAEERLAPCAGRATDTKPGAGP